LIASSGTVKSFPNSLIDGIEVYPLFVKAALVAFVPIGAFMVSFILAAFATCIHKHSSYWRNLIVTNIVLMFVVLPPITSITFALYNCVDVFNDENTYLAVDVDIQCWEGDHNYYAKKVGIPSTVFWIVGVPLVALFILFRRRQRLHDPEVISTYGFLYLGLRSKAFYWEVLLHFRKVAMISINVFFTTFKPLYRVSEKQLIGRL